MVRTLTARIVALLVGLSLLVLGAETYRALAAPNDPAPATQPKDSAGGGAEPAAAGAGPAANGAEPSGEGVAKADAAPARASIASLKERATPTPLWARMMSLLGIAVLIGLAMLFSVNRQAISWRPVVFGIGLQIVLGLIVLSPAVGDFFFDAVNGGVARLLSFSEKGADFLFQSVEPHAIETPNPETGQLEKQVYIGRISPPLKSVAFWILPTIIFFSALMTIFYHLGIMQTLVRWTAGIMQKTMGTSGSESLSAAANIFVGQTEAPLVVRPFIEKMTSSELHAIMVGGFATVAGGVLAAYVGFLHNALPDIAGHLVVASIMSAPAALAISKIMFPETEVSETRAGAKLAVERPDHNLVEALARGTTEGLTLAVNVAAMLVSFVAMVALVNWIFGLVGLLFSMDLTFEMVLGWLFAPIAWCMGVPWDEAHIVGRLLGEKMVLTELIAYINLAEILKDPEALSYRSAVISSYALCGFANFASIGIQIGGIGAIAPGRRTDLAMIGVRAMIGGTIAAMMTATIAGIIL